MIWNGACLTFPNKLWIPTKSPPPFTHDDTTFIEELQEALEAIQALQQELEMSKLVNSYDEFFFTEKIKDKEFELSEEILVPPHPADGTESCVAGKYLGPGLAVTWNEN